MAMAADVFGDVFGNVWQLRDRPYLLAAPLLAIGLALFALASLQEPKAPVSPSAAAAVSAAPPARRDLAPSPETAPGSAVASSAATLPAATAPEAEHAVVIPEVTPPSEMALVLDAARQAGQSEPAVLAGSFPATETPPVQATTPRPPVPVATATIGQRLAVFWMHWVAAARAQVQDSIVAEGSGRTASAPATAPLRVMQAIPPADVAESTTIAREDAPQLAVLEPAIKISDLPLIDLAPDMGLIVISTPR